MNILAYEFFKKVSLFAAVVQTILQLYNCCERIRFLFPFSGFINKKGNAYKNRYAKLCVISGMTVLYLTGNRCKF